MKLVVITGASRGIGAALARRFVDSGDAVIGIARSPEPQWMGQARTAGSPARYLRCDFSDPDAVAACARGLFSECGHDYDEAILVNNAGVLEPVGPIGSHGAEAVAAHVAINLTAALIMTEIFVAATEAWPVPRKVLHVSSGAARQPIAGWGCYCATKAGLDMAARVLKAEQAGRPNPVRVVSLAPGVVDTPMQSAIRALPEARFAAVGRFRGMYARGELSSPEQAAAKLAARLARADFGEVEVGDVRD